MNVIYKTARIIEELAVRNNAIIIIGNVHRGKKKLVEKNRKSSQRHRIQL